MQLGPYTIKGHTVLAPMAGVSDYAYRTICAELGAAVTVTEMVSSRALVYQDKKSVGLLKKTSTGLCGAQIFGNDPTIMQEAAQLAIEHSGCDFLDINMGCPMPKIVNNGDGSALLKDPELAGRLVEAVKKAVHVPVTVKTRIGWDKGAINIVEFAKLLQDAGASAITSPRQDENHALFRDRQLGRHPAGAAGRCNPCLLPMAMSFMQTRPCTAGPGQAVRS